MGRGLRADLQSTGLFCKHLSSISDGLGAVLGTGGAEKSKAPFGSQGIPDLMEDTDV